jgi:glycosyltransferase involved in cell wall biosynthesis
MGWGINPSSIKFMPKTSVIIPAYNQARYLNQAIESVLNQTDPDFELVVVDDGSTDDTAQIAHTFSDKRLRYIYQENRGLSAARNAGIHHTSAPFITFLDSDDVFLPEKISCLAEALQQHPEFGLVAGQAIPIDEEGLRIGKIFDKPIPKEPSLLLLGNPLHVGSVMLRRECQEKVGDFDESLRSYEDWDMWLRLARNGCGFGWVPRPVSLYRFHTAQMTRIGTQMTTSTFAVLDKVYADANLPEEWQSLRDKAYSHAHLRAAAQAYLAHDFDYARNQLRKAVQLNSELANGEGRALADLFISWTELPKVRDRFQFLEGVFNHLPEEIPALQKNRRQYLGEAAIQMAFQAYLTGDYKMTRNAVIHAIRYQPHWMINRGAVSIFIRSSFR